MEQKFQVSGSDTCGNSVGQSSVDIFKHSFLWPEGWEGGWGSRCCSIVLTQLCSICSTDEVVGKSSDGTSLSCGRVSSRDIVTGNECQVFVPVGGLGGGVGSECSLVLEVIEDHGISYIDVGVVRLSLPVGVLGIIYCLLGGVKAQLGSQVEYIGQVSHVQISSSLVSVSGSSIVLDNLRGDGVVISVECSLNTGGGSTLEEGVELGDGGSYKSLCNIGVTSITYGCGIVEDHHSSDLVGLRFGVEVSEDEVKKALGSGQRCIGGNDRGF